jgi:hypothetical protein
MGMRVASSNNAWAAQANTNTAALQQRQQNSQALFASLSAGDLSGAQSAMTKLSTADSNAQAGASKVNNPNSPFSQIGTALQKGDLKSAQAIAISMQAKNGKHQHGAKALTAENHTNTSTAMNSLTTLLTGSNNTSGSNLQQSIAASTSANLTASNSSASSVLGIGSKINLSA